MAMIRWRPMWDPFEMDKYFEDMPNMPEKMTAFTPAVDVYQDKDNVNISVENDILKIEGKSEHQSEVDEKNYYRKEVRFGSFYRAVALPTHVKADKAQANFENGLLKVIIPKAEEVKPKTIKVSVKKAPKK